MDIIVTTPKNQMAAAAKEAQNCIKAGSGFYFRRFNTHPVGIKPGEKVWYVEDGYIRAMPLTSMMSLLLYSRKK